MQRFAVVGCSDCKRPWAVETRFAQVKCPRCSKRTWLADHKKFWQGDNAREAQAAIVAMTNRGEMF